MVPEVVPDPDFFDFDHVAGRNEELRYRLAPGCKVHVRFTGIATQAAIRKLISYLELGISDFPRDTDHSSTQNLHSTADITPHRA